MDKKDVKDSIVFLLKIYYVMIAIVGIPINIIFSIIGGITNGNILGTILENTLSMLIIALYLGVIIHIIAGLVFLFVELNRKFSILNSNIYIRELPEYFPPALASLLLDSSIEVTTDYTATIAYLISKKIIKISDGNVEILNSTPFFKSGHEKYVFECITKQKSFTNDVFSKMVIQDAKNMNLIQEGKRKIHFLRNFVISVVCCFILSFIIENCTNPILNTIFSIIGLICELSVFGVIIYSLFLLIKYRNESIYRTYKGKKEAYRWTGLKKYLHNYTLISDRNLNDIELFDDYIPYAIALGEAKNIEKYINNNIQYRELIYSKNK